MARQRMSLATATSRGLVLDLIRMHGPISRVELAERTGLTQATMSNVVRQLLIDGLVLEAGRGESTGGKPRVLLGINPASRFAIGIQLGADTITYVVTNLGGAIVGRLRTKGAGDAAPADAVRAIGSQITSFVSSLGIDTDLIVGIGVVAPGPLDVDSGSVLAPPTLQSWSDFPIESALADVTSLPIVLDNDATAAAVGDFWSGAVANAAAHCSIYMGAGLGAGFVLGGTVYRGASSNAGELGQIRLYGAGSAGTSATIEETAGPKAIAANARAALAAGRSSTIALTDDGDPFGDFAAVAAAAVRNDELARELITESAESLADAVVALANLLDLDSIVLSGPSFSVVGSLYVSVIRQRVDAEFVARAKHGIRVQLSPQLTDAAAVGGATLIMQKVLAPRQLGVVAPVAVWQ